MDDTLKKLDEIENVLEDERSYSALSPEDERWLAEFPEEKRLKIIRKVTSTLQPFGGSILSVTGS